MTDLQKHILDKFYNSGEDMFFNGRTYNTIFREMMSFYIVLDAASVNSNSTVMITGKFDHSWISALFACILRKCRVFIYPDKMDMQKIPFYMNRHGVEYILADNEHTDYLRGYSVFNKQPFIKGLFNMETHKFSMTRTSIVNSVIGVNGILEHAYELDIDLGIEIISKNLKGPSNAKIYTLSAGRRTGTPRVIINDHVSIFKAYLNSCPVIDLEEDEEIEIEMHNADKFFITTVLNTFLSGARVFSPLKYNHSDTIMFDTKAFEDFWYWHIKQGKRTLLDKIFDSLSWYVRIKWRKQLNYYLGKDTRIIILNAELPEDVMATLRGRSNVITTFGSVETNHFTCWNDYSTKALKRKNTIGSNLGRTFPTVEVHCNGAETKIVADHLYKGTSVAPGHGVPDKLLREDLLNTSDFMHVNTVDDTPIVFYRGNNVLEKNGIWYDRVEREVKSLPFVKNAIFSDVGRFDMTLVIEPDVQEAEAHKIGYVGLKQVFESFLGQLNSKYGSTIASNVVILADDTFIPLTYDGRNQYWVYRDI